MYKLEPLGSKVVLTVQEAEKKTAGGIIIPDGVTEKPTFGTIVAVNKETAADFNVEKGTQLLFGKFSGTDIELEGNEFKILEMDEAFAIIRDVEPEAKATTKADVKLL